MPFSVMFYLSINIISDVYPKNCKVFKMNVHEKFYWSMFYMKIHIYFSVLIAVFIIGCEMYYQFLKENSFNSQFFVESFTFNIWSLKNLMRVHIEISWHLITHLESWQISHCWETWLRSLWVKLAPFLMQGKKIPLLTRRNKILFYIKMSHL